MKLTTIAAVSADVPSKVFASPFGFMGVFGVGEKTDAGCHSVAGEENYILKVRVDSPAALESLLAKIRSEAGVSTRTTIVLSTPYEARPLPL